MKFNLFIVCFLIADMGWNLYKFGMWASSFGENGFLVLACIDLIFIFWGIRILSRPNRRKY